MRIGKVEKLVPNLEDKKTFVVKNQKFELGIKVDCMFLSCHVRVLKHGLKLKQYIGLLYLGKPIR